MSNPTTTALQGAGGGGGGGNNHLLNSGSTTTSLITNDSSNSPLDNLHFASSQLLSLLHAKDEALQVLKSDLMDALNNEVKSLDEDNWMFEGPRSRISMISKPGGSFAMRDRKSINQWNIGPSS